MRTCIVCREKKPKNELLHICYNHAKPLIDPVSANGRGAYLCYDKTCMEACFKKNALDRAFRTGLGEKEKEELRLKLSRILMGLKMEEQAN